MIPIEYVITGFAILLLVGWFFTVVLDFSLYGGLLLGAIISSTDAAAVFKVLGSRRVSLRGSLRPLLELESGSNDPMAVMLTIGFIGLLKNPNASPLGLIPDTMAGRMKNGGDGNEAGAASGHSHSNPP